MSSRKGRDDDVHRFAWRSGCVAAFVGVAAGAFGAHVLKGRLDAELLGVFETGVRYQLYHALALLAAAGSGAQPSSRARSTAVVAFVSGIVLFSGSLMLLALTGMRWLGAVTPFGGVAFLVGWVALALAVPEWVASSGGGVAEPGSRTR